MADTKILIYGFVSSRRDYDDYVSLSGLQCQMVLNAAARILTKTRKFDGITPILASLHQLLIHVRSCPAHPFIYF